MARLYIIMLAATIAAFAFYFAAQGWEGEINEYPNRISATEVAAP